MDTDPHSELVRVLKRDSAQERAQAERHLTLARHMDTLIALLEAGGTPSVEQLSQLHESNGNGRKLELPPPVPPSDGGGTNGRKFQRTPKYESLSTVAAVRKILAEQGPTHADELARMIFDVPREDFQKVKSVVVSEVVKGIKKRHEFRRSGENIFALAEGKV